MGSLTVNSEEDMSRDLVDVTAQLAAAVQAMPIVSPEIIEGYRWDNASHNNSDFLKGGNLIFSQVTNINRWNENMEAIDSIQNIGLFTPWPEIGEKKIIDDASPNSFLGKSTGFRKRTSFKMPT